MELEINKNEKEKEKKENQQNVENKKSEDSREIPHIAKLLLQKINMATEATEEQKIDITTEFITTDKDNLKVDYYSQVDGLTGNVNDDILDKIQACTESANEKINNNLALLENHQNKLSNRKKQGLQNENVTLKKFKVASKIWYDNLMSEDRSKDADIYKFKDKSKVEMKNETATEEIFQ